MAPEKENKPPAGPKVSPARTIVSLVVLLVVGVVCAIELRAGLGQMLTGKAFAAKSEDGAFKDLKLSDAKALISGFPKESIHRETETETVLKYSWFSLLRPMMGESSPEMYLVASRDEVPLAHGFHTALEEDPALPPSAPSGPPSALPSGPPQGASMMPSGGRGGMGMGGPGGGRGPGAGGKSRPKMEGEPESPAGVPADGLPEATGTATEPPATEPPATTPAETPAAEGAAPAEPTGAEPTGAEPPAAGAEAPAAEPGAAPPQ